MLISCRLFPSEHLEAKSKQQDNLEMDTSDAVDTEEPPESPSTPAQPPSKKRRLSEPAPRKMNTPFQRIKLDEVEFVDPRLQDNSFDARVRFSPASMYRVVYLIQY
jgi:hypothetical protein